MNSLPPDSAFRLTDGEIEAIKLLRGTAIEAEAFRKKRERWESNALLTSIGGSHRLYPYLADVIALCKANPVDYKSPRGNIPHSDALKYRLLGDSYAEGLYAPTPSNHRLHGLLDFLYFPDRVRAEAGEHFGALVRLWKLMAMTVDDTLYRHSSTAYALYAPLWEDISLRFTLGFELIEVATYYGDYELAEKFLDFLQKQIRLLSKQSDVDYYTDNIERLTLNSQGHYQDVANCLDDLHRYRLLYEGICARNASVLALSPEEQDRHLKLIRATCRGACRFSVRYVMRVLGNNGDIGAGTLEDAAYLANEYNSPTLHRQWLNHHNVPRSNHDWDTASRTWAVVLAEHYKSLGDTHLMGIALADAHRFQQRASEANIIRRNKDHAFLEDVLARPEVARWTGGVDKGRVQNYVGSLYDFWEKLSCAMLKLQVGRAARSGGDRTCRQHLMEAKKILHGLTLKRHSPKLRHSGYLLASIHQLLELELQGIDQGGSGADG